MNPDAIGRLIVVSAVIPANCFPVLYATRPWAISYVGRALMVQAVGLALLVDLTILVYAFGDYPGRHVVFVIVDAIVSVGLWMLFVSLFRETFGYHIPKRRRDARD